MPHLPRALKPLLGLAGLLLILSALGLSLARQTAPESSVLLALSAAVETTDTPGIYLLGPDGARRARLTPTDSLSRRALFPRDDLTLYYETTVGRPQLWRYDPQTGARRELLRDELARLVMWNVSPDGR